MILFLVLLISPVALALSRLPTCIRPVCSNATSCQDSGRPVCGYKIEFQTFLNECYLGAIGCNQGFYYYQDGECNIQGGSSTRPRCSQSNNTADPCIIPTCREAKCDSTYRAPVCGIKIDLKYFPNICSLASYGCREGYRFARYGECSGDSIPDLTATGN